MHWEYFIRVRDEDRPCADAWLNSKLLVGGASAVCDYRLDYLRFGDGYAFADAAIALEFKVVFG